MKNHLVASTCLLFVLSIPTLAADDAKSDMNRSINDLTMEVEALKNFFTLKLTENQLKEIAKIARETAEPARKRSVVKGSDDLRKSLMDLCEALIDASDEDKIDDLEEEVDRNLENVRDELDNSFEVTDAARKRAPEVIKLLNVNQLASYYGSIAEEVMDPRPYLLDALAEVRGLNPAEWRNKRDEVASEIAWSVAGVDAEKAEKINDKVLALLLKARLLSDEEFKAKREELEKEVKLIVGGTTAAELLRHNAERMAAQMLSNPQLEAAIKATQK